LKLNLTNGILKVSIFILLMKNRKEGRKEEKEGRRANDQYNLIIALILIITSAIGPN
jgi:hypothetical protein